MNKNDLRKHYINIRNNIQNRSTKDKIIFDALVCSKEYNSSQVIAIYNSLNSEVDTKCLINYSISNGKIILIPKVIGDNMSFYKIESLDNLIKSNFGIDEPLNGIEYIKDNIDLVIVPLICFDSNLNRIGFGKGYYDKFLEGYYNNTIGIAYQEQYFDGNIPSEKTDIKLKKIITDKNIYISK